jgi:lactaldehyde dehydrogenase
MSQNAVTRLDKRMLIDGEWVDGDGRVDVIHPYDGSRVGSVPLATADQVRSAIDAAERAREASTLSAYERYELLETTAEKLDANADHVATVLTSEQGKPITEARGEVDRAVQTLQLSAEQSKRMFGEYVPMDAQKGFTRDHCFTQREPLGVVAAITPFNFPINLMAHKVGPALAAGNAVVGKPASNTPLVSVLLFEYLQEAAEAVGAPDGLVNLVTGGGSTVGDAILEHDAVEAISFTGSTPVGKYLANNSGMKEVTLELGGNDPTIVWDDTDIEKAAEAVVGGACSNAGQVCNSVERVIVHDTIESEFVDAAVDAVEALSVGDPFDESTDVASWSTTSSSRRSSTCTRRRSTPARPSRPAETTAATSAPGCSNRPCYRTSRRRCPPRRRRRSGRWSRS